MATKCGNCGSSVGGMFGAVLVSSANIAKYKAVIQCPDQLCTNCDGPFLATFEKEQLAQQQQAAAASRQAAVAAETVMSAALLKMPVVSVDTLPPGTRYKLIDLVSFQSTLGTGLFSEFGSDISNILGTEAKMLNSKMGQSVSKCKDAIKALAYRAGGNAVIGVNFQFSTNTRDATTVAVQGTAVFVENVDEVFKM